jgi:hypothetical protein
MVSIFCATAALLYADQNLMAPNLTAIAKGKKNLSLLISNISSNQHKTHNQLQISDLMIKKEINT